MKIFKIKSILFAIATALVVVASLPILQSCSNDEPQIEGAKQLEFLDMDVSNIANATEEQKIIFSKAKERIDKYVILKNKQYSLVIKSGSEIQISERLFKFFQETIIQTNLIVENLNVIQTNSKVLHVVDKTKMAGNLRFKIKNPENIAINSTDYDVSWSGVDIYISSSTLNGIALGSTSIATISAMLPEPIISKTSAGILGLTAAVTGYTAAQCPNGIVVHIPWVGFNSYGVQE